MNAYLDHIEGSADLGTGWKRPKLADGTWPKAQFVKLSNIGDTFLGTVEHVSQWQSDKQAPSDDPKKHVKYVQLGRAGDNEYFTLKISSIGHKKAVGKELARLELDDIPIGALFGMKLTKQTPGKFAKPANDFDVKIKMPDTAAE